MKKIIEIVEQLSCSNNPRKELLEIREALKNLEEIKEVDGNIWEQISLFMKSEDKKSRKLAVEILGMAKCQRYLDAIYALYQDEETLFVRPDYLKAMEKLNYKVLVPQLKTRMDEIRAMEVEEACKVHLDEEMKQLYKMIVQAEGMKEHHFTGVKQEVELLLTTKAGLEDITYRQLTGVKKKKVPGGVMVKTSDLDIVSQIRTYEERLFYFGTVEQVEHDEGQLMTSILELGVCQFIKNCHKETHPMGIHIQYNGKMDVDKKGAFIRKLGRELEKQTMGWLFNTTTGYEAQMRVVQVGEHKFRVLLKLFTFKDYRFDYRKESLPVSIKPYMAANLLQLALPFLKEGAQIMDPYCGVGTMLIERRMVTLCKDTYGVDQYGDAIKKARMNSEQIGPMIHYVQRDFADFSHDYLFDEFITNMPTMTRKVSKNEVSACYGNLFSKGRSLLKEGGIMIVYGNEHGTMKRLLRMNKEFELLRDVEVDAKYEFHLYVIGYKTR